MKTDSELLEGVTLEMLATTRTKAPNPDDANQWIEIHDTETGRITWTRRDLYGEWNRLQLKIREIE